MAVITQRQQAIRRQYRIWRAMVGLSQEALEAKCREVFPEMRVGRIRRIEHGEIYPTPSEVKALCAVLNVTPEELPSENTDEAAQQPAEARAS